MVDMVPTTPVTTRRLLLKRLRKLAPGTIVRYRDLQDLGASAGAVAMALTRLQQQGLVERVTKGRYRLPETGRVRVQLPAVLSREQVVARVEP